MNTSRILSLLIFTLVIGGLTAVNGAVVLLALPFTLYLAAGLLARPDAPRLEATRTLTPDRVLVGEPVTVHLTLTNRGAALADLHLRDALPEGLTPRDGATAWLLALEAGATQTFTYTLSGLRGIYHLSHCEAVVRDGLGLLRQTTVLPAAHDLFVLPSRAALKQIDIRPRRTRVYAGTIAARIGGTGTDFFGVRAYQQGDALRRINWKASARRPDEWFTNEYEQERVADVGIILDARAISNAPHGQGESMLEQSIAATTLLVDAFINQGNRVALLIYGHILDYTLPGYGKLQREKLLHALAGARLGATTVFAELRALPTQLFPPQSQIVFVSPLLPDDAPFLRRLRAYGYQVLVVAPNPISYEVNQLSDKPAVAFAARAARLERGLLLRQLQQAGIYVLDWDTAKPFDEVVGTRLRATLMT